MKIQTYMLAAVASVALLTAGCEEETNQSSGSSSSSSASGSTSSSSGMGGAGGTGGMGGAGGSGGSGDAKMPVLGTQIDRMGRPAINTAVNKTFEADDAKAAAGKDEWNANSDPSKWASYVPEIQANLAILDSLDTDCGNQLLADKTKMDATRYATLAGVLADDRLYVNLAGTTCATYLGVEASAVGVPGLDMECGGRGLAYDVMDTSYTVLATGALDGSVGDDVPASDAAKGTTFPYLAAPY